MDLNVRRKQQRVERAAISPFGVRSVWLRDDLQTMRFRLKALEAKMAQEGRVLSGTRLVAGLAILKCIKCISFIRSDGPRGLAVLCSAGVVGPACPNRSYQTAPLNRHNLFLFAVSIQSPACSESPSESASTRIC